MQDKNIFEEMDLTSNQGKVYSKLTEFGALTAAEVSSKSGVPYGRIYDVLNSLVEKGLVEIVPEKTKKYSPTSPENLIKLIEEKQKTLEKAKQKATQLKQFYEKKEKKPISLMYGIKGFWKIVKEQKQEEKYAYTIKWKSDFKSDIAKKRKKKIKKGIDIRDLVRYDNETKENVQDWLKYSKEIKKIKNNGIAMSIIDDKEVMISLIKNDTTMLIRDPAFAKIMKKLYLAYYSKAKKVETQ